MSRGRSSEVVLQRVGLKRILWRMLREVMGREALAKFGRFSISILKQKQHCNQSDPVLSLNIYIFKATLRDHLQEFSKWLHLIFTRSFCVMAK